MFRHGRNFQVRTASKRWKTQVAPTPGRPVPALVLGQDRRMARARKRRSGAAPNAVRERRNTRCGGVVKFPRPRSPPGARGSRPVKCRRHSSGRRQMTGPSSPAQRPAIPAGFPGRRARPEIRPRGEAPSARRRRARRDPPFHWRHSCWRKSNPRARQSGLGRHGPPFYAGQC